MQRVLFVCLGNICRSPTAEAVFRARAEERGMLDGLHIDSAGTGSWHVGKAPDRRTLAAAVRRGYQMDELRARQVQRDDFNRFDFILAMDHANLSDLMRLRPRDFAGHLGLFLEFHPETPNGLDVPDPYYGGGKGFERVLDLVECACDGLLDHLRLERG